ncbi:HigA family addiction module antitoxin [Noviherbaspirillum malthae]|uniref:HigA family addiction module antitoxin n=1 Tax=Noviherbaspirillum malthae TaxID=1260987 RepID=UPI00188F7496|nr:HigA family addiction module antitoxin [Noviherbaspirillum malthae]
MAIRRDAPFTTSDQPAATAQRSRLASAGEILKTTYMNGMAITAYRLSPAIGVAQARISQIANNKRAITADTDWRPDEFHTLEASFFLNLQQRHDLDPVRAALGNRLDVIPTFDRVEAG